MVMCATPGTDAAILLLAAYYAFNMLEQQSVFKSYSSQKDLPHECYKYDRKYTITVKTVTDAGHQ